MPKIGLNSAKADVVSGIVILAAATAMLAHTYSDIYDSGLLFGDVSTVFVPRILLFAICALAAGLVVKGAFFGIGGESLEPMNWGGIASTFAAACATTAGVWYFGYSIAMPVGVFLTGLAIGYRNWKVLLTASLLGPLVVWITLGYFARVSMPEGQIY